MCSHNCNHGCCHHRLDMTQYGKGVLCGAYHEAERPDKLEWGHFPDCNCGNCPKENPSLLQGAKLDEVIVEC